ncbi:MAG: amidophosphoribosyltransferase [Christensenellaceae bacterium]|nr:amidophosphoribosyltransferase [Christensenellaceae bacterium]
MSGFFAVASKNDCVFDLFFGTDYHSHLGTKRGGMAVYGESGFQRAIHNIENSPFRTKFERDVTEMHGSLGIGCISDSEPQPLLVRSHLGNFAITTVGRINNADELISSSLDKKSTHFLEMSGGDVNPTELTAALISKKDSIKEGLEYVQSVIDGSLSVIVLTPDGIYVSRDRFGRTPAFIGKKSDAFCVSFESFAYLNLEYSDFKELGAGEIDFVTPDGVTVLSEPKKEMRICTFLWTYYGYPAACYEGVNVEKMRCRCGAKLADADKNLSSDSVAGVPDSGTAVAIGYSNRSGIPFSRPFIKYTPTWPRSFMPVNQNRRDLIARMKLIPVDTLIRDKKLVLIDDSLVRGTQMRETTDFLYRSGAKEVHVRLSCPPVLFACKYLNFSRSTSDMDLITRRVIARLEGEKAQEKLHLYSDPSTDEYKNMVEEIRKELKFTSLNYLSLDDTLSAVGCDKNKLCTYCWNGKE